jgi:hypothetical protein
MQIFTNEYQKYNGYSIITPSTTTINGQIVSPRFIQREGSNDIVKDIFTISGFSGKILLKLSQIPQSDIIVSEDLNIYTEINNENLVEAQKFYYKGKGYVLIYIPDNSEHIINVQYTGMGSLISAEDIWELQSGNLLNDIFTIPKDLIINKDTTIKGNLFIYGTLETVDLSQTNELRVLDKYIYLNYNKTYDFNTDYGIAINDNDISKFKLNFNNDVFSLKYYNGSSYDTYFNASSTTINLNKDTLIFGNLLINNGNVGIGTTTPSAKLQVVGGAIMPAVGNSSNAGIYFPANPGGGSGDEAFIRYYVESGENTKLLIGIGNDSDDDISFYQYGAERLTIYNGNVGIGTTTPSYKLTIAGSGSIFAVDNQASFVAKNSNGTYEGYLWPRWSDNVMYLNYGSGGFNIRNSSSISAMFITNSNNVGIGTTSPSEKLHVVGNIGISAGTNAFIGTKDNYALSLRTNNVDRIYITNNGDIGIGTTNPNSKLHIFGSETLNGVSNSSRIIIGGNGGDAMLHLMESTNGWNIRHKASDNTLRFSNVLGGTDWVVFTETGNVGIGTTSPSEKLDVNGNIKLTGNLLIGNGTAGDKIIIANNAYTNKPSIKHDNATGRWMYTDNGVDWNYFGNINSPTWYKITVNYMQLNSSNPLLIYTMPANSILHGVKIKHYQQFNAGSGNIYKLSLGNLSNYTKYSSQFEVTTSVANDNFYLNNILAAETTNTWSIYLYGKAYNSSGSEISATLTQGAVDIWLLISITQPSST